MERAELRFGKLHAISVTADGKTIFAANSGSNTIAVVDVDKRAITTTLSVAKVDRASNRVVGTLAAPARSL